MTDLMTPHRRLNLLTGEWVLVSPHRMGRPWQGDTSASQVQEPVAHDPNCYLCAGNVRVGGVNNPNYDGVWVFDNDFPALLPEAESTPISTEMLLVRENESGVCRVIVTHPITAKPWQ